MSNEKVRQHKWKVKRGHDMLEDGYLRVERCTQCPASRISLLKAGSMELRIIFTDPAPLAEECPQTFDPPPALISQPGSRSQ